MKTNGVFPLWGVAFPSAFAAFLPHYNTMVICTAFLHFIPSCAFIPNVRPLLHIPTGCPKVNAQIIIIISKHSLFIYVQGVS